MTNAYAVIGKDAEPLLDWLALTEELQAGHTLPKADISDQIVRRAADTLLNRSAWIDGLGLGVKCATIFPENDQHGLPSINGSMSLFNDTTGLLDAMVDIHLVTKWKTAGDSLLAARLLARPETKNILIVGAGTVANTLLEAYSALFPDARFAIWNRSHEKAQKLAEEQAGHYEIHAVEDLEQAVKAADLVSSATMATAPIIKGAWLQPGQHIDLIGAYRPDMREADDEAMQRARIFVDSRDTTIPHIGELIEPIASGAIRADDIVADYYDIASNIYKRTSNDEITLFKNGGGAHLDLITAKYIQSCWQKANPTI